MQIWTSSYLVAFAQVDPKKDWLVHLQKKTAVWLDLGTVEINLFKSTFLGNWADCCGIPEIWRFSRVDFWSFQNLDFWVILVPISMIWGAQAQKITMVPKITKKIGKLQGIWGVLPPSH